jgi:hypothetical protein
VIPSHRTFLEFKSDLPSRYLKAMHFKTLEGRKSAYLEDRYDEPLIITLKTGKTYAGFVDECFYNGGGVIALYACRLLDKTNKRWIDHDVFTTFEGRTVRDFLPEFWISEIKRVELFSDELQDKVDFEDALQLYVDPHFKPMPHVECNWDSNHRSNQHTADCESRLHEALSFLAAQSVQSLSLYKENQESQESVLDRINQSFRLVRRRLLMTGARIP